MQKQEMSILHGVDCRVIPNGVDLEIFRLGNQASARRTLGLPEQARIVLLIAHSPFKDLATMEAALARVRPVDNKSLLYLCLGREDEEKQVGAGTMRYVKLQRDLERLIKYYQAADIYLHAAFADTFPNTIAEAMACGLPVVATDTGGIPELIEDGSNGFLVAPQDPVQMAQKIEYLINNPEKCEQMRAAAARHARTNFDVNVQVNRLLEWYREIVADWSQWVGRHTAPRTEVR